jgi:protein-S-isoprenylcysteine O-methyltransferase Ste14
MNWRAILSLVSLTNAWVLVVPLWVAGIAVSGSSARGRRRAADMSWYSAKDRFVSFAGMAFMVAFMGVSVFVPLVWPSLLCGIGIALAAVGAAANLAAKVEYLRASADGPVTAGVYRVSRNPMYASYSLVMLGAALASASVLLGVLWLMSALFAHVLIIGEERYCSEKYGAAYADYMQRVPRYALFF